MTEWPPIKAWTSISSIKGSRHFVAINYGVEHGMRWVNLVCVVNGSLYFRVPFEDLIDLRFWLPGWQEIDRKNDFPSEIKQPCNFEDGCLHPSLDSGLIVSSDCIDYRPWFASI